jgi:membrane protease YdiL (CAAX protease family)
LIRRSLFSSPTGALHPVWRIAAFAVISILSLVASAGLVGPLVSGAYGLLGVRGVSNDAWVGAIGLLAATAICVRMIDKRPWSDVWLDNDAARPSAWLIGLVVGALCIGVPTVLLVATGWLTRTPGEFGSWTAAMVRTSLVLIPAALTEELMTRGYVLAVLRKWWGWPWAVIATSVGFGLIHLQNPGATATSMGYVMLAGVFLFAVLYATRSLYAAWMAHFAWNWTIAAVFHAAVSGYPFESPGYRYVDAGPDWATGGEWGPEAGIPAALGMLAGIAFFLRRRAVSAPIVNDSTRTGNELDG